MTYYNTDLAYVHDTVYGNFARNAAGMIVDVLKEYSLEKELIAALGCGSGTLSKK